MIYHAQPPDKIWSIGGNERQLLFEVTQYAQGEKDSGGWPTLIERDFVTGCCFLASRQTFEQIGLFDDNFSMYYEDLDFSRRVRSAGLRILVIPKAKAWHNVASSSGGRDTPNERYWMARSSVLFFRKHGRNWRMPLILFWRLGSAIRTSWRLYRSGNSAAIAAYWRGLKDGFIPPTP
jgi:GT2 family glycosyltransferase